MNEQSKRIRQKPKLPPDIIQKFQQLGFSSFTKIQSEAIPLILQKKDTLVIAPTGSGKTETSVIPVFSFLKKSKIPGKIKCLYITPLRALNRDVFRRMTKYAQAEELSIEIRHGDTTQTARRRINKTPPDILITTPESLVILLTQPVMLNALSELEWVIIDEVHELLSSERGSQLTLSLERLQFNSTRHLNRIGLSATVGNVEEAGKFLVGTKRKVTIIRDTSVRKYDIDIQYVPGNISEISDFIIDYTSKLNLDSPILLFTNTRGEAELLASVLKTKSPMLVELHHGSLSKQVREETETSLREGNRGIVVCTSSLELGLDIGSIDLVIHYGSPKQVSKLIQRIGRSRHNRTSSARGLIIANNIDDEIEIKAILERIHEGSIEEQKIHLGSMDVLAHHLVGLSMQLGEIDVENVLKLVNQAYPFRLITLSEIIRILDLLDSNFLIFFDKEKMTFKKKARSFRYYFENLSTIPDILKFKVFDAINKKIIGSLDQRFVGDFGEPGNIFVLRGTQWRIINVDEKSLTVNVEPYRTGGINIPYWEGETIPVDYTTAKKVGLFRTKQVIKKTDESEIYSRSWLPLDYSSIVIESSKSSGIVVMHACFGTKINSTLGLLLSSMLSSFIGTMVEHRADAYRITLSSNARLTENLVNNVLKDNYDLPSIITASLTGTHNISWRTWCVAKKFGIVGRNAVYDKKSARFLYERYIKTPLAEEALRELFHDKYEINGTEKILEKIRKGEISLIWNEVEKFSKLAESILDHSKRYSSSPSNIDKGLLDLVKKRLMKTKQRLICARCGRWEKVVQTEEIEFPLSCPYCRARQITTTFASDQDLSNIIRKKHNGQKLSTDETHKLQRAWKSASLVENFGKNAIIVLSGYGIGPDTGARILRNMVEEEYMYKQIYEAERQFVVTRGFWDN